MPKFVVERTLPGAGALTAAELSDYAQRVNEAVDALTGRAQWVLTYVTDDKLYCVYIADDEDTVLEHAQCAESPVDSTRLIRAVIDPTTA